MEKKYTTKLKQLALVSALITPFSANADVLSFAIGGGGWNASPTGNFQKTTDPAAVDVKENLFWKEETNTYIYATLEHPVPILPNVRLISTKIDQSGSGNTNFVFDGITYSGDISNEFSIETLDLIAYYEVLDNVVSIDIGLNIRNLKFDYTIVNGTTTTDTVDETVPMVYALVGGSPIPDLLISGELSYIAYDGSTISDFTAKIAYTTSYFVGVEAGYRAQSFEFDDVSETNAKLDFDGVFVGAYLKF